MAMVGSMVGMHSVWAAGDDIVISSTGVNPNDYGGGYDIAGIWGVGGTMTLGDNVNSITTDGAVADLVVYGICGTESVSADSISGGIDVKSTNSIAYAVYLAGSGTNNAISGLGDIAAEAGGICAYGIYLKNLGSEKFSVAFATAGGNISAYNTNSGSTSSNNGIYFDAGSTGKLEVLNVNKIVAGVSGSNVSSVHVYGISARGGENTVKFTGSDRSITAKSSGGAVYGIVLNGTGTTTITDLGSITAETTGAGKEAYGISSKNTGSNTFSVGFDTTGGSISAYSASGENYGINFVKDSTGTSEVKNVKTITAGVATTGGSISSGHAYGIYAAGGVNTVTFTGAESSITAKSGGDNAYGIYLESTGTNTITDLGSITAETSGSSKIAYGIYAKNTNTDDKKFSVAFDSANGGSISAYSESSANYGIKFDTGSTGKTEVKNVKTITAGISGSNVSSGKAHGIYAEAGVNTVEFVSGSSIKAKSSNSNVYGIIWKGGQNTISGLGSITAENNGNPIVYGIYSQNTNTAPQSQSDVATFSISFDSTNGGTISAYSAPGANYGIIFKKNDGGSTGKTEVKNVKTITAGISGNNVSSGSAYGIKAEAGVNTVTFTGADSSIKVKSSGQSAVVGGIYASNATGTTTVTNLGSITAEGCMSTYGIYSEGNDASFKNNTTFVTSGGTIKSTSSNNNAYGICAAGTGITTVENLSSIMAKTSATDKNAYGIYSAGTDTSFANNVSFKGNGGQAITATNTTTAANAYSISAEGKGATTVNFENSILSGKISQSGDATLTLNFGDKGVWDVKKDDVSGTVTANVNNGGTIKFAGVNESYSGGNVNVIVSNGGTIDTRSRDDEGKVVTTGGTTKTVNLGSGTFNAQPGSKISLDALTKDNGLTMDQVKTTGIVGGTIALGSVNIKVATATTAWETAKNANIFVDGASQAQAGITIMGTTTTTTDNYVYTFTGGTSGSVSATSVLAEYKLPQVIQANPENAGKADAYSFDKGDITLEADLGTLNNTYRTSGKPEFTIFGNDHSLIANGKGGVTINTGDTLTVKNLTISGFDTFATNTGILNLTDVTFTGTTGTADVVNNATGEVNIAGTVVLDKGIANEGTVFVGDGAVLTGEVRGGGILEFKGNVDIDSPKVANNIKIDDGKKVSIGSATEAKTVDVTSNSIVINKEAELTVKSKDSGKVVMAENVTITGHENGVLRVTEGSFLEYNNTTEKTIKAQDNNTFTVIVEKDATLDPVVSVFAEGVNVQVDGGGTLVLQPGTLFANIHQDAGSVLKVAAEDIKTTALLSGVDKASQLDVSAGTLQLTGTVKLNDSFKLVEGAAVTNGTITMADMWHVQADGLNGLLGELVMDKGVIGLEVRNVRTAVEANTSALAGVQQGAAAMVNQLTDKVAENLTLAQRPAAEGKYDKQVWASYINSKETVDDRDLWNLKGSNTAKYRGAIVGADFYTSDKVIAGMAISYAKGDISANTIDSTHVQNDSKYYGVSFYDRVTNGPVALTYDIGYQYGKNDISMTARDHITSDVDTQSYTAGVRAERAYKVSKTSTFAPFVSLRYLRLHTKEYKNSNQAKFDANDQNLFIPKLGVAWHGDFVNAKSGWSFKPVAEIGYIFNIGNRSAESKYITATSRAFNTEYDVVDSGTYYGKLGFRVAKKNFFIGADYNYQKGSTTKNSRWNVNLGWSF